MPFIVEHAKYVETFGDHSTPMDEAIANTLNYFISLTSEVRPSNQEREQ
ncbi:hypothetical protein [Vibrio sonorensis]|nr:hypothetical protein [Vibrio sonorensis]